MKKYNSNSTFFGTGPFAEVEGRLEDFSASLYLSFLFKENIEQQNAIEEEYRQALLDNDEQLAETKKNELAMFENIYVLSLTAYDQSELVS